MADAILFAASDVIRREESLKLILVITDGQPDDIGATRNIIERARDDGIHVVGLGIGTEVDSTFGPADSATVSDIGELSSSMVKLVKTAFERQRKRS